MLVRHFKIMPPVISILIPTRWRRERLLKTIASINDTSPDKTKVEIIVRCGDDDETMKDFALDAKGRYGAGHVPVIVFSGLGWTYGELHKSYQELAARATGTWMMIFSDDTTIGGDDWVAKLESVPTTGFMVHPEWLTNNLSVYRCVGGGPMPAIPRNCLKEYGLKMETPIDTWIYTSLRDRGWKNCFIKGMTIYHERIVDRTLPKERY